MIHVVLCCVVLCCVVLCCVVLCSLVCILILTFCLSDKDICGGKLALDIQADGYIILTDGGGIWEKFGKPEAREMAAATPEYLLGTKAGKAL